MMTSVRLFPGVLESLQESPFVRSIWAWTGERSTAWIMLIEAWAVGADRRRIRELMKKWNMGNWDAPHLAQDLEGQIDLAQDTDSWWARFSDDPSTAEVGEDVLEALGKLAMRGLTGKRVERT